MSSGISYHTRKIRAVTVAPIAQTPPSVPVVLPQWAPIQTPPSVYVSLPPIPAPLAPITPTWKEQIETAKKGAPITIKDEQMKVLTIKNSCTITFLNCTAESLEVTGDWVEVKLIGLTLYGAVPVHVGAKCVLQNCRITSTKDPLKIVANKLTLERCEVEVTGTNIFQVADKASVSVRDSQLHVQDITQDVSCFELQGKSEVSLRDSRVKLHGDCCGCALLIRAQPDNGSYVKLFGTSIRARAGNYLTCRYPMNLKSFRTHCDQFSTARLDKNTTTAHLNSLAGDPLYRKRNFFVEESLAFAESTSFSSQKLSFTGKSNISDDFDLEGSIFLRSLSSPSFVRGEHDFLSKLLVTSFRLRATLYDCHFVLTDLILDGNLTFNSCRVLLRECRVVGVITCNESSVKCESVQFAIESQLHMKFCKGKFLHCDFKSVPVFDDCEVLQVGPSPVNTDRIVPELTDAS